MNLNRWLCILAGVLLMSAATYGQSRDLVKASLLVDSSAIVPGGTFDVGVLLDISPGWHVYWMYSGDAGIPTRVKWTLPEGFEVGTLRYPTPLRLEDPGEIITYGYEHQVMLVATVKAPERIKPGESVAIEAQANWLVCKETCIPGKAKLTATVEVAEKATPANQEIFDAWRGQVPVPAADAAGVEIVKLESSPLEEGTPVRMSAVLRFLEAPSRFEVFPALTQELKYERPMVRTVGQELHLAFELTRMKGLAVQSDELPVVIAYPGPDGSRRAFELRFPLK